MASDTNDPLAPDFGAGALDRALELVRFLRVHCSWDRDQTHESLIPYLLEEAHEVTDAIRTANKNDLEGELGDLLLNLAFQIVIGEERNTFTANSVVERLENKMRRRHPHLFGLGDKEDWEALKSKERPREVSALADLPTGLDPLHRAHRIQERASGVGFDWPDASGAWQKVGEELAEVGKALDAGEPVDLEEELGDLLFSVVNLVRRTGNHSAILLERANRKFTRRFQRVEEMSVERGFLLRETALEELNAIWEDVKKEECQ